jgi:hypothetical protein
MSGETFERKVTTPAEREARKTFRQVEAERATKDHERALESRLLITITVKPEPAKATARLFRTRLCIDRRCCTSSIRRFVDQTRV